MNIVRGAMILMGAATGGVTMWMVSTQGWGKMQPFARTLNALPKGKRAEYKDKLGGQYEYMLVSSEQDNGDW